MSFDIYALRLEDTLGEEGYQQLIGLLSPQRRERLDRTRKEKHGQVLCAYGLLRLALQESCGLQSIPSIACAEERKPYFPDKADIHFSLSHTEGAVMVAVCDRAVGVDLERRRTASAALVRGIGAADQENFWNTWVAREAIAKCRGRGFSALVRWDVRLEAGIAYRNVPLFSGYCAAGAVEGEWEDPKLHICTVADILVR